MSIIFLFIFLNVNVNASSVTSVNVPIFRHFINRLLYSILRQQIDIFSACQIIFPRININTGVGYLRIPEISTRISPLSFYFLGKTFQSFHLPWSSLYKDGKPLSGPYNKPKPIYHGYKHKYNSRNTVPLSPYVCVLGRIQIWDTDPQH